MDKVTDCGQGIKTKKSDVNPDDAACQGPRRVLEYQDQVLVRTRKYFKKSGCLAEETSQQPYSAYQVETKCYVPPQGTICEEDELVCHKNRIKRTITQRYPSSAITRTWSTTYRKDGTKSSFVRNYDGSKRTQLKLTFEEDGQHFSNRTDYSEDGQVISVWKFKHDKKTMACQAVFKKDVQNDGPNGEMVPVVSGQTVGGFARCDALSRDWNMLEVPRTGSRLNIPGVKVANEVEVVDAEWVGAQDLTKVKLKIKFSSSKPTTVYTQVATDQNGNHVVARRARDGNHPSETWKTSKRVHYSGLNIRSDSVDTQTISVFYHDDGIRGDRSNDRVTVRRAQWDRMERVCKMGSNRKCLGGARWKGHRHFRVVHIVDRRPEKTTTVYSKYQEETGYGGTANGHYTLRQVKDKRTSTERIGQFPLCGLQPVPGSIFQRASIAHNVRKGFECQ